MVIVKQSERPIEKLRTPPLPAEALAPPGTHQVPPGLLFDPFTDDLKASSRAANAEVEDPTSKNRVDLLNDPLDRLGSVALENPSQFLIERSALLELRRVDGPPLA